MAHYAAAESLNSRQFYEECQKPERYDFCLGFIQGLVSTIAIESLRVNFHPFCLPDDQDAPPLVDLVVTYLRKNPSGLGKPAALHITEALEDAFPCPPPEVAGFADHAVYAFPVTTMSWLISGTKDPVFLFDDIPDGFPLDMDGDGLTGFYVEAYGNGLRGYRTHTAKIQVLLKDGTLLETEGKVRVLGELAALNRPLVPLFLAVGIDANIKPADVKAVVLEHLR